MSERSLIDRSTQSKSRKAKEIGDLSFLLGCSQASLGNYELAKLSSVQNLRRNLYEILDQVISEMTQAALAAWFRDTDRQSLIHALENEEDAMAWAARVLKERGRNAVELALPNAPQLAPGRAHIEASVRYQDQNIAEGKCQVCPEPLAAGSVRYCEEHLTKCRDRARAKSKQMGKAPHGRAPGTLAALAQARESRKQPGGAK